MPPRLSPTDPAPTTGKLPFHQGPGRFNRLDSDSLREQSLIERAASIQHQTVSVSRTLCSSRQPTRLCNADRTHTLCPRLTDIPRHALVRRRTERGPRQKPSRYKDRRAHGTPIGSCRNSARIDRAACSCDHDSLDLHQTARKPAPEERHQPFLRRYQTTSHDSPRLLHVGSRIGPSPTSPRNNARVCHDIPPMSCWLAVCNVKGTKAGCTPLDEQRVVGSRRSGVHAIGLTPSTTPPSGSTKYGFTELADDQPPLHSIAVLKLRPESPTHPGPDHPVYLETSSPQKRQLADKLAGLADHMFRAPFSRWSM